MTIPEKPSHVTWTDEQWKAIHAKGQDILVAAAAGSGKTAVLVERIIQKIIDPADPVNIDEILVATFTDAAAQEMRHRIGLAIEEEIKKNPASYHLRKQLSLLNNASISTLHSFCLNVVRKYYYAIDIDPGFRIADETESDLLKEEVLEELLEEEYGKENNDPFYRVVDTFTRDRSDQDLTELILKLFEFSRSHPDPEGWLDQFVEIYECKGIERVDDLPFIGPLLLDIELQLKEARNMFQQGLEMTRLPGGPTPRAENFEADLEVVDRLLAAKNESFSRLYTEIQLASFGRLKSCRGDEFDPDLVEESKHIRDKGKDIIKNVQEQFFSRKPETFLNDLREMQEPVAVLVSLVKKFAERLAELKKEKGLVDFSDLEHFTLQILGKKNGATGELEPTDAALDYRKKFKEVFIDEYQDTNMVQEQILQLVKKPTEAEGNLFMVGDVKQSIYRFRLAEPMLFLQKYQRFNTDGKDSGLRIDLAKNFRSRKEVLAGTNFLFKQLMGGQVGEIEYDERAELKKGAPYPEEDRFPVELAILYKEGGKEQEPAGDSDEDGDFFSQEEMEQSEMEAKYVARQIRSFIDEGKQVFDPKTKAYRPLQYKDIVILLRSMNWAPKFLEALKDQDIPGYANVSSGYFQTAEIMTMLSLLKVIDNPYQDIPITSVLRSPVVGLNEEQLARIRVIDKRGAFYEAVKQFASSRHNNAEDEEIAAMLVNFLQDLERWRSLARENSLSDLIWQIYRDTGFYDYVGGLPGGKQRQANLRSFYDRARNYESTSFRGLFRFLRFIERMQDRGDDLGEAPFLGEQENVVRLMTIHKSKGLEFPVVFICGLGRKFNMRDLYNPYLFDKNFGFATNYINPEKQITYPSLIHMSISRKKRLELIAEEMRVLYVAMTRAKEKLYLVASTKQLEKLLDQWKQHVDHPDWLLPEYTRLKSMSYLDWIGPALVRHRDGKPLVGDVAVQPDDELYHHESSWQIELISEQQLAQSESEEESAEEQLLNFVKEGKAVPVESEWKEKIHQQLTWQYPHRHATLKHSKQSVSDLKRLWEARDSESGIDLIRSFPRPITTRPKFLQEQALTPQEKGTAMHIVMQHLDFSIEPTKASLAEQVHLLEEKELLTAEEASSIDIEGILGFFETEIGTRIRNARWLKREIPFSLAMNPQDIYTDWEGEDDTVFIQGIIDCLFEDDEGFVLLDYKTDQITGRFPQGFEQARPVLLKRYQTQITLYRKAVEAILKRKVDASYLFFFDGSHLLKVN